MTFSDQSLQPSLKPSPCVFLAPMQGLVDDVMRDVLTRIGGFDGCVTEFVRITHTLHGQNTWLKYMPELMNNNCTPSGTTVAIQLLGSDAAIMAENALHAIDLGARHIDLNFGCPAPTVNQHQGGAILLQEPKRIEQIVYTIQRRLPSDVVLSAKMRLGYEHKNLALACAQAIENGGAQQLTVHARTKTEGYKPPAHWHWIKLIREGVSLPLIANGDIFSLNDYCTAREISGCNDVMLGRGAVRQPDLARQITRYNLGKDVFVMDWPEATSWINQFFELCCAKQASKNYPIARLKQWLAMLKITYPEADNLFNQIRTLTTIDEVRACLKNHIASK